MVVVGAGNFKRIQLVMDTAVHRQTEKNSPLMCLLQKYTVVIDNMIRGRQLSLYDSVRYTRNV